MTTSSPPTPSTQRGNRIDASMRLGSALRGLARSMRPRQWVKNVLVLGAPFAGGIIFQWPVLVAVGVAFAAFSLAASGIYLVNDVQDVEADRAHPTKCHRPIAAGLVSPRLALAAAVVLLLAALGVSLLASTDLVLVTGIYIAVQLAYCWPVSATPSSGSRSSPARRSASRWSATRRPTCVSYGRSPPAV